MIFPFYDLVDQEIEDFEDQEISYTLQNTDHHSIHVRKNSKAKNSYWIRITEESVRPNCSLLSSTKLVRIKFKLEEMNTNKTPSKIHGTSV